MNKIFGFLVSLLAACQIGLAAGDTPIQNLKLIGSGNGNGNSFTNLNNVSLTGSVQFLTGTNVSSLTASMVATLAGTAPTGSLVILYAKTPTNSVPSNQVATVGYVASHAPAQSGTNYYANQAGTAAVANAGAGGFAVNGTNVVLDGQDVNAPNITTTNISFSKLVSGVINGWSMIDNDLATPWAVAQRTYAVGLVFSNKMWCLGGYSGSRKNDVWNYDGATWTLITNAAPWRQRYQFCGGVLSNEMYIFAGDSGNHPANKEVWSTFDGLNWTRHADLPTGIVGPTGEERYGAGFCTLNNKMYLLGGDISLIMNDVWSTSDGENWVCICTNAPWKERMFFPVTVHDNKMWLAGGYADNSVGYLTNDVWYSSDGINWYEATDNAAFAKVQDNSLESYDGKLWMIGGEGVGYQYYSNSWYSSDGTNWYDAASLSLHPETEEGNLTAYSNKLYIYNGADSISSRTNMWFLFLTNVTYTTNVNYDYLTNLTALANKSPTNVVDDMGLISVDGVNRCLVDNNGTNSVNWDNRILYDAINALSLDWNTRYLYGMLWQMNGSLAVSNNLTVNNTNVMGKIDGLTYMPTAGTSYYANVAGTSALANAGASGFSIDGNLVLTNAPAQSGTNYYANQAGTAVVAYVFNGYSYSYSRATPTNMTDYTVPAPYVVTCSSDIPTRPAWALFDGITNTASSRWNASTKLAWATIDLTTNISLGKYIVTAGSDYPEYAPTAWAMQGSFDGAAFTNIDTQTNLADWVVAEARTYTVAMAAPSYRYFKLLAISKSTEVILGELQLQAIGGSLTTPVPLVTSTSTTVYVNGSLVIGGSLLVGTVNVLDAVDATSNSVQAKLNIATNALRSDIVTWATNRLYMSDVSDGGYEIHTSTFPVAFASVPYVTASLADDDVDQLAIVNVLDRQTTYFKWEIRTSAGVVTNGWHINYVAGQ